MSNKKYDFSGWATRANILCSDGRTIRDGAFKHQDGKTVPLVWNHMHNDPENTLGWALLQHRDGGVYTYCAFNNTPKAAIAKELVLHGDIDSLSICANQLKQDSSRNVLHGMIREVSLVLAGANSEATIDNIIRHGEESEEEAIIQIANADCGMQLEHADENNEETDEDNKESEDSEETVQDVIDSMTEKQQNVLWALVGQALEHNAEESEEDEETNEDSEETNEETSEEDEENKEETNMKHNVFDKETQTNDTLQHADFGVIIENAKKSSVGSFKEAYNQYAESNQLQHGYNEIENLFPDYKDVKPGAPELIERDLGWVMGVINGVDKCPFTRLRTRQMDARAKELRAKGYQNKGDQKTLSANLTLLKRTTDPQTIYRKDELHRDDIVDITDFDIVEYQYKVMKNNMYEDIALAIMVGDGRDDEHADKIQEDKIRPIWKDEELYTIHADVDFEGAKAKLQGTNTGANFGEEYIQTEAIVASALHARNKYKGKAKLAFYCTPTTLTTMLLARDLNGRRIYNSVSDIAAALNVSAIHTVEQFENLTRTTKDSKVKKLVGLFVNLGAYRLGSTKGGELTKFEDFDIDFNKYKYLMETRLSGALVDIYSAIALEEDVTDAE